MPQGKHSTIQGELVTWINQQLKVRKVARAFPELRCTFGDRSIVPDIAVFAWDRIPRDENRQISDSFAIAPDWTIEILSPMQSQTRVVKNIVHCLHYGTEMGWLIDPNEQTVFVYRSGQEIAILDKASDLLPMPSFAIDLHLTLEMMFTWLIE